MLQKAVKFILFPSRYLKHQNKGLLIAELSIKSNISRCLYYIAQKILFPRRVVETSIITINKRRQELALDEIKLDDKNINLTHNIAQNSSLYFEKNIDDFKQSNPKSYIMPLNEYLSNEDHKKVRLIANDDQLLRHSARWLGIKSKLKHYIIYANFPNNNLIDDEGSKLWHRDLNVYKAAEYYINLTNCNDEHGPLFIFKDPASNRLFQPHFPNKLQKMDPWRKCRWFDEDLKRFSPDKFPNMIYDNKGKIGKVTFLDSGIHMHKGGATKNSYRIVLRLIFESENMVPDSKIKSAMNPTKLLETISNNLLKLKTFG